MYFYVVSNSLMYCINLSLTFSLYYIIYSQVNSKSLWYIQVYRGCSKVRRVKPGTILYIIKSLRE